MSEKAAKSLQREGHNIDYKAKYELLYAAVGEANTERKVILTNIAKDVKALLKIICEPDPPGCSGKIPDNNLEELLLNVQQANALKQEKLEGIADEIDILMQKMCDPDPPGCVINQ
jgi:hypothetical protein